MLCRLSLFLALVLAVGPRPGAAEVPGSGLAMPIRPPMQGFVSLFQSPPPRIIRDSASPTPPNPAFVATTPRPGQPITGTNASGGMCRPALVAAEARHGIPSGLLQAIGVVESGRRDEATGARQPWPWTINAEGEPHFFDTKAQAVEWVRQAQARGMRSIDIGCAQVNLMHHPTAFASLEEAFDPAANADYAARFLKELRNTTAGGDWMTAAGYYHSQTPERAEPYRQQVQAAMTRGSAPMLPAVALASAAPSSPFAPIGPGQAPATAPAEHGRLMAAPSGTVGRGLDAYRAVPIQMAAAIRPLPSAGRP
jgi:Transglycosylase SLT domain